MKKLLLIFLTLLFLTSCLTVVFEPYWEKSEQGKKNDYPQPNPVSGTDNETHSRQ